MQFDIATIHTMIFFLQVIMAGFHGWSWLRHRDQPALLTWTVANVIGAMSAVLLLYPGDLHQLASVVLPSVGIVGFLALAWIGVRQTLDRPAPWATCASLSLFQAVGCSYFVLIEPLMWARFAITALVSVAFCAIIAWDLMKLNRGARWQSIHLITMVIGVHGVVFLGALIGTLVMRPTGTYVSLSTGVANFAVLESAIAITLINVAIAMLMQERLRSRLNAVATTDALTGLANRNQLATQFTATLRHFETDRLRPAVCIIDLDGFKDVNDTYGHQRGDMLLVQVSVTLQSALGTAGSIARLGGDEFAVLLSGRPSLTDHEATCQKLQTALKQPFEVEGSVIQIGSSMGIAVIETLDQTLTESLRRADIAMYAAKQAGRDAIRTFDRRMDVDVHEANWLRSELRQAMERDELHLTYQPLYDVSQQPPRIVGVEALVRWTHPIRGPISPAVFVPLAEHTGLIHTLGAWVLRRACLDARAWADITLAVNISPAQFEQSGFTDVVRQALAESGLPASRLELEVTERVFLKSDPVTLETLDALRRLGTRLALDDFGTGYSSLSYLKSGQYTTIKIDRCFVQDCVRTGEAQAVTQAVIQLAHAIGAEVVAEGVETAAELDCLKVMGCHLIQGFLLGRPMTARALETLLPRPAARPLRRA
jgi:diguanylate cyclase (GGDEF)-like protein